MRKILGKASGQYQVQNTSSDREPHSSLVTLIKPGGNVSKVFAFQSPYLGCLKMTSQIKNDSYIFLIFPFECG